MAVRKIDIKTKLRVIQGNKVLAEIGNYQLIEKKVFGFNYEVINTNTKSSELFTNINEAATYIMWRYNHEKTTSI